MIKIAGVSFTGLAAPESFRLGGEQKIATKELPGGSVEQQARGYFANLENTWDGSFYRADAIDICLKFDRLCATRAPVVVAFGRYSYNCRVTKFVWDWKNDNLIDFTITLTRDLSAVITPMASDPIAKVLPTKEPSKTTTAVQKKVHVVVQGDSLSKIAFKYGTTVDTLYAENRRTIGSNPSLISPGQRLVIPG